MEFMKHFSTLLQNFSSVRCRESWIPNESESQYRPVCFYSDVNISSLGHLERWGSSSLTRAHMLARPEVGTVGGEEIARIN